MLVPGQPASGSFFTYPALTIAHQDYNIMQLEKERLAFLGMKGELLRNDRYRGKYIAILDGRLVDSDEDLKRLAKRVYSMHGYIPIYMDKVTEESIRKFENSSPESSTS